MVDVRAGAGESPASLREATGDANAAGADIEELYSLLNDQPVENIEGDPLRIMEIAGRIASVITASMSSSPFVIAVDAGWGMGKSTLLRQIERRLWPQPGITTLRFNAWTAEGEDALEGLIKAVLVELDPNILRRWARRLGRQRNLMWFAQLALSLVARLFGVARLVDELWERMGADAKSRNELRDLIHGMLSDWIQRDGKRDPGRALVVFIDDLDRCADDVIVKVCEAVKLYLDAPGLIFVMACDQSVLARGVAVAARGQASQGRAYLEKIVQIAYRMPPPEEDQLRNLISAYAAESGTAELIDETVTKILAEGTGRNPRRIKRIINSFIIEYRLDLDLAWRQPPLGSAQLVTAVLLQHLHPSFYDLLVSEESDINPVEEFLDYVRVRERVSDPPADAHDPWWEVVQRSFKAHNVQPPADKEKLASELERLLPEGFPGLGRNHGFIELLRGVEQAGAVEEFRAQLVRRPLATASLGTSEVPQAPGRPRRWSVRTGADRDAQKLIGQAPTKTTIANLRALDRPADLPLEGRSPGAEETLWQLDATLTEYKRTVIGDYKLVIADDQGSTMIAKIPDPAVLAPGSFFAQQIAVSRQAFESRFGIRETTNRQLFTPGIPVTLQGLGFFDNVHGQIGVAPNAIELNPVISIIFRDASPAAAGP